MTDDTILFSGLACHRLLVNLNRDHLRPCYQLWFIIHQRPIYPSLVTEGGQQSQIQILWTSLISQCDSVSSFLRVCREKKQSCVVTCGQLNSRKRLIFHFQYPVTLKMFVIHSSLFEMKSNIQISSTTVRSSGRCPSLDCFDNSQADQPFRATERL